MLVGTSALDAIVTILCTGVLLKPQKGRSKSKSDISDPAAAARPSLGTVVLPRCRPPARPPQLRSHPGAGHRAGAGVGVSSSGLG